MQEWIADTIIIVDDGSTDKTLAIALQFESDKVRVVPQKTKIEKVFGWRVTKRAQVFLPTVRCSVERFGDKPLAMPGRCARKRLSHTTT